MFPDLAICVDGVIRRYSDAKWRFAVNVQNVSVLIRHIWHSVSVSMYICWKLEPVIILSWYCDFHYPELSLSIFCFFCMMLLYSVMVYPAPALVQRLLRVGAASSSSVWMLILIILTVFPFVHCTAVWMLIVAFVLIFHLIFSTSDFHFLLSLVLFIQWALLACSCLRHLHQLPGRTAHRTLS